ncbi:hypothetical protein GCM10009844_34480 [Nocardioides koreensis]|uniref:DUF3048 domain-containing protein n=1 Tax=Nocardioides koreensis TaxID=433651 RepID=A0ABN3A1B0_9ACTN
MRRAPLPAAVLIAASLVLAGCGGGDETTSEDSSPASQKVAGGSTLDSTWPLTGLPVSGDQSASQDHPVLVAKMDNTYSSAPQIGLSKADMVVEELVEGGLTRLAAFYYSQVPGEVGPVRSMRASDIGIVSPVDADVVTSGAAARTIARIKGAGITFFQEGAKGLHRDSGRSAPYNLFADLGEVSSTIKQDEARPDDYLPWGGDKDMPKGQPAKTIAASFSGGHTTNWSYRDGGYVNENTYAADGDEFPADTVLVLRVQVGDAGYLDPAGNHVPETKFTGSGAALLFHDGRLVKGTWKKGDLKSPLQLSTKAGKLTVPAGHTWIELVPSNGGNVTYKK